MFLVGMSVVAVMIWRLVITLHPETRSDFIYGLGRIALTSFLELWIGIIVVSLPTLAPLFKRYITPIISRRPPSPAHVRLREAQHTIWSIHVKHRVDSMLDSARGESVESEQGYSGQVTPYGDSDRADGDRKLLQKMEEAGHSRIADYIIVGGGTAALVVACRLSENPDTRIIVLERGKDESNDACVKNPLAYESLTGSEMDWNLKMAPQAGLNNREFHQSAGKALSGRVVHDQWLYLPSPGCSGTRCLGFTGHSGLELGNAGTLFPQGIHLASEQQGVPAYYRSHPNAWKRAFEESGYHYTSDLVPEGTTIGTRPYTATIDPQSGNRSSAASGYGAILASRANVEIFTRANVTRIWFDSAIPNRNPTATGVEVQTEAQGTIIFKPTKEVIMAAGVFNNPKILELSGIGDTDRLQELRIPPLVHLPGVGENLSNHAMSILTAPLRDHLDIKGISPGMKANAFIRLSPPDVQEILARSREGNDHTSISGILAGPNEASACIHFAIYPGNVAVVGVYPSYSFSRGSSHLQSTDPTDAPRIDPKF
ncbi:glucose-methanol-choline (gmc) oxidoreductase [Aspergillus affinis]|uniref:glucose-methanol-choline (gmc) oxidoreductase n=1 Tax=Aspergillus affinis TaxID=1070780 RepID=UPI0022FE1C95|nr:glucose-methanol-choline (gmc) oxidoreductase [Aspergillus affinis]KAI9038717.1 glucose-methanol-choline (gmc) oxidoreductase [Aspergillus affinis]